METTSARQLPQLLFAFLRTLKQEFASEELSAASWIHLETLRFVEENAPAMQEVAAYLKVKAPTATSLVDSLVADGFIVRSEDAADRRRVKLSITANGRTCLKQAARAKENALKRVTAALSSRERDELARLLSRITRIA